MALYSYLFGLIIACVSYFVYHQKYVNMNSSLITKPNKRYDYVIVGAGTAGCVLAARLSENPNTSVLLIEAGDQMGYFTKMPLTATAAQLGPNDWTVKTTRQKYSSFGLWDQTQFLPRGKGLGGSGQINFLLHGFGLPEDYEQWAKMGVKGWTLEDLKPYFIKAFGTAKSEFDSEHCSLDGYCPGDKAPMKLKLSDEENDLYNAFKKASARTKTNNTVFRRATATVKDGLRFSTFDAYLKPVLNRRNLHVLVNTQGISIRFDNKTASSIYILQNHRQLNNVFVNKEVILSAGAIKTPQILILSGIGPEKLIRRLKIKPIVPNESVGANLHDHMTVPLYVTTRAGAGGLTLGKVFNLETLWDYYWYGRGPLSFPPVLGCEYRGPSAVMLFNMAASSERMLREISNYKRTVFFATFPFHNATSTAGLMLLATCAQPRSRGRVGLEDVSTKLQPLVDPKYLEKTWDVQCMVNAMRRAEQLVSTSEFRSLGARLHWPRPERCLSLWRYTREEQLGRKKLKPYQKNQKQRPPHSPLKSPPDEYLHCVVREVAVTGHHVAGTCAIGTVLDDELRVKSVTGLRVMDASVLPSPVSLYPNSVIVGMAERAADLIKTEGK